MKIAELVNTHYHELSENDVYIWNYIQSNMSACASMSINELADHCHVSKTTILRFAQKLSLKGYSELKVCLGWEKRDLDIHIDDKLIDNVCDMCEYALKDMRERDFHDLCVMLYDARRIIVYGTGSLQKSVANELQRMFLYCGEFLYVMSGEKETEMVLPFLNHEDVVILISLSGEGVIINEFADQLRTMNIPTISMTKLKDNELARKSTKSIYITTSQVMIGNKILHETANLFFVLAEILFLHYTQYKDKQTVKQKNEL